MGYNILVVDDDDELRNVLSIYLKNEGMTVFCAKNGLEALKLVSEEDIHLIIMDIMMPQMDGINATLKIRESHNIPIIILSAKSEDTDIIMGLNIGADDYVSKPYKMLELIARVKSQLRRYVKFGAYKEDDNVLEIRGLTLNKETKEVSVHGKDVRLTALEFKILQFLMERPGAIFSIQQIYENVWNEPFLGSENTVAVHIRRIREKIEVNPGEPIYLKVVWGIGYKIEK